jgi:hypothetical protein
MSNGSKKLWRFCNSRDPDADVVIVVCQTRSGEAVAATITQPRKPVTPFVPSRLAALHPLAERQDLEESANLPSPEVIAAAATHPLVVWQKGRRCNIQSVLTRSIRTLMQSLVRGASRNCPCLVL